MKRHNLICFVLACSLLLGAPSAAFAQESAESQGQGTSQEQDLESSQTEASSSSDSEESQPEESQPEESQESAENPDTDLPDSELPPADGGQEDGGDLGDPSDPADPHPENPDKDLDPVPPPMENTVTQTGEEIMVLAEMDDDALVIDVDLKVTNNQLVFRLVPDAGEQQISSGEMTFTNRGKVPVALELASYNLNCKKPGGNSSEIALQWDPLDFDRLNRDEKSVFLWLNVKGKNGTYPEYSKEYSDRVFRDMHDRAYSPYDSYSYSEVYMDPLGILNTNDQLTCKIDGELNYLGPWKAGDVISVTPVFNLIPQIQEETE